MSAPVPGLPGFPTAKLQSQTVGSSGESAIREIAPFYRYVRGACAQLGRPLHPGAIMLDFGICWGRITRFFLRDVEPTGLHGVDVSAEYLAAARRTGCPARLRRVDPQGRLPYANGTFDLVYSYSVFTHLPEPVADLWLAEIARVLKPSGVFVATVEPPSFLDAFKDVDPNDPAVNPWKTDTVRRIKADPGLNDRLSAQGIAYIGAGAYGDTVVTEKYVRAHWGRFVTVLGYFAPETALQAVVTAVKPLLS